MTIHRREESRVQQKGKDIDPPPYTSSLPGHGASSSALRAANRSSSLQKPLPPPRPEPSPRPSVSQIHINERKDQISGTFHIDPTIPSIGFDAGRDKARNKNPPHASFRTRQGPISLDLGTTGDISAAAPKAKVLVRTRSGNISIKLLPNPHSRPRLGLEAISRGGNIVLFVPKTFSGVIHLNTRKGSLEFLPALASCVKVLKESDTEALILVGDQSATETREMDFCQLNTRDGKLTAGLSDVDKIETKISFWKKLFGG